jgi:hypothetical protein
MQKGTGKHNRPFDTPATCTPQLVQQQVKKLRCVFHGVAEHGPAETGRKGAQQFGALLAGDGDSVYRVLQLAHKQLAQAGCWRGVVTGVEPHGHKRLHGGVQETRHPQVDKPAALLLVRAPLSWPRQRHLARNRRVNASQQTA